MKRKIGSIKDKSIVEGDANLLTNNELLVKEDGGFTIIQERKCNGKLRTYVIVPLECFDKKNIDKLQEHGD